MGLLDDAIREHLDLKRRRGGDPAEIERAEREALGPVRRGPETTLEIEPDPTAVSYEEAAPAEWSDPDEDDWEASELAYDEPAVGLADTADGPPTPRAPHPGTAETPPAHSDAAEMPLDPPAVEFAPGPADPSQPLPHAAPDVFDPEEPVGGETVEYDVEEALTRKPNAKEDVLEETPEFLQDTPDHDRLWFEQRPPKDFDFDG
ncbi:MAG: hypothetical protein ACYC91_04975 [Solirubrobacteraceae bacterium]